MAAEPRPLLLAIVTTLATVVVLGWVLHTDPGGAVLGKYTRRHAAFLAAVLVTVGAMLVYGWWWRRRVEIWLRSRWSTVAPTAIFVVVVTPYLYAYSHNRYLRAEIFSPLGEEAHSFLQIDEPFYPPLPMERSAGSLRVVCLGGSTTLGVGLEREEAYPAVLQDLLQERLAGVEVEVINAGCTWHSSQHSLLKYLTRAAAYRPDAVIVLHAFNDIFQASSWKLGSGGFRGDYGHFFGALGKRVKPVDRFNRRLAELLVPRHWYTDIRGRLEEPDRRPVDLLAPLPSFRRNLRRLAQLCRLDGVQLVMASQPFIYHQGMTAEEVATLFYRYYYEGADLWPTIDEQRAAMVAFNQAAREVAAEVGTPFVDLEAAVPKSLDYMFDDVHYTALGARTVAAGFARDVRWQ